MKKNTKEERKEEMKRKRNLKEKGITLVALVVTIIVLLILAGVTIQLALNNNGIINRAKISSETWSNATENESAQLSQFASDIDTLTEGYTNIPITPDFTITDSNVKPANSTTAVTPLSTEKTVSLADNKGNIVKVPKNFGIAYDSGNNVAEGIVIEYTGESDSDPLKGNQYVWVPVGQAVTKTDGTTMPAITLGRYDFDAKWNSSTSKVEGEGNATLKQSADNWDTPTSITPTGKSWNVYEYSADDTNGSTLKNTKANDLEGFITSAQSNHGYYIARYEAGNGATNGKPLSQNDKNTWVSITQLNAATKCQGMYEGLNSDLINSYAWDTTIAFIQQSLNIKYSKDNRGSNTSLVKTGKSGDEKCKINDMAKNVLEWTTETCTYVEGSYSYYCVFRGGYHKNDTFFTALRSNATNGYSNAALGFRPILYV